LLMFSSFNIVSIGCSITARRRVHIDHRNHSAAGIGLTS
jgi:hypothetical protein